MIVVYRSKSMLLLTLVNVFLYFYRKNVRRRCLVVFPYFSRVAFIQNTDECGAAQYDSVCKCDEPTIEVNVRYTTHKRSHGGKMYSVPSRHATSASPFEPDGLAAAVFLLISGHQFFWCIDTQSVNRLTRFKYHRISSSLDENLKFLLHKA